METGSDTAHPETMASVAPGSIVVGVDDSAHAEAAVAWAASQASLTHRPLALVYAADLPETYSEFWAGGESFDPYRRKQEVQKQAGELLEGVADRVRAAHSGLEVHAHVTLADARHALLEAAGQAFLVVVGSRGRGPVGSLLLGSVSAAVSRHATCPVVVMRPGATEHAGGVVVGVDARSSSRPVLDFAFSVASARQKPLTVVHTHVDEIAMAYGLHVVADVSEVEEASRSLAEAVAGFSEQYPDVQVTRTVRGEEVDHALLTADAEASLLVVGRRHHGSWLDSLHSGVATAVLEHATTAVAVVPTS